jgi:hypothetical protein
VSGWGDSVLAKEESYSDVVFMGKYVPEQMKLLLALSKRESVSRHIGEN